MGRKDRHKRSFPFLKLILVLLVLLVVAGAILAYFPALLFTTAAVETDISPKSGLDLTGKNTINIALLGFDGPVSEQEEQNLYRPDLILIAAFNYRQGTASLVSIPRDSYVNIHGTNIYDKINHSFMYGHYRAEAGQNRYHSGIETTLKTIVDFLGGVPLHGYAVVDMQGVEEIIDRLGGIYYDVETEVRSDFGRGRLLVEEGYQLLDGKKFMYYVRNRAGFQGGESGRTERQRNIMIALFDNFKQPANIPRIPSFYLAFRENVDTNLNLPRLLTLGLFGLRVNASEIETAVFSGSGQLSERDGRNIWYLVIDEIERVRIIEKIFGLTVQQRQQLILPGPMAPELEEPEAEPELETEPVPEIDPEPEKDPGLEPEPEVEPEPEPEPDPEPEPEPEEEPDQEDEAENGPPEQGLEDGSDPDQENELEEPVNN